MTLRLPSIRVLSGMLAAALVFFLVSPLQDHVLWSGKSYAENPAGSPPNDTLETTDESGARTRCRDIPEAKGGTLIGYVVPCIIYSIEHTSINFSKKMIEWLMPMVWAFITFVVTMFGLKVLQGEGEVHKQGFLLLLKISLVVSVLQMIPTVAIPQLYGIMKETQQVVATTIGDANTEIHCDVDRYGDENTMPVWKQLDCVMGKLYGFTMGTDGHPSMLLAASVFGLLGGFFFGGTFGVALFVALIGVLWSMFALILRTAFTFLNAYLYATLMLLVAPLFLPLTLLKVSSSYFDRWWSSILACILLPLIVTAYVMFAMMAYDKLLFGPDAEINKLFEYSNVQEAQRLPRQACDRSVAGNAAQRSQISGIAESLLYQNPFMQNFATPTQRAANNLCAGLNLPVLQIQDIHSTDYQNEKQWFTEMFMHAIKLLVMTLLVSVGFKNVVSYAKMMIGSYSAGGMMDATSKQEQQFARGIEEAQKGLREGFLDAQGNTTSGAQFMERIPGAIGRSLIGSGDPNNPGGFLGGISRSSE
jgi:type IV secretory pathway VirB6-like protein